MFCLLLDSLLQLQLLDNLVHLSVFVLIHQLLSELLNFILQVLIFIFDGLNDADFGHFDIVVFPFPEVADQVHFLDLHFKFLQLKLHGFVLHRLFLESCFFSDEIGAYKELAIAKDANVAAWDLAVDAQSCFWEIALFLAASFARVLTTKFAENLVRILLKDNIFATGAAVCVDFCLCGA